MPVALLSFCGGSCWGSALVKQSRCLALPWLDMPLLRPSFIWMSKVGSFLQLPAGDVLSIPLGLAREQRRRRLRRLGGCAVMNLAVSAWLTAKACRTTVAIIAKANNIEHHHRYSVDRYRDLGAVIAGIIVWLLPNAFITFACRTPGLLRHPRADRHHRGAGSLVGLAIPLVCQSSPSGSTPSGR